MNISNKGIALAKIDEGVKYTCYKDNKGIDTIGIGHLILHSEEYLLTATLSDQEVIDLFNKDMASREAWINSNCVWDNPIIQQEFDAICCFLFQYNIDLYPGMKNALICGNRQDIVNHMMLFINSTAGNGDNLLVPRRKREINMFLKGTLSGE